MEIVLSIICIVLLVIVIYLLYTTQMKLHEKIVQTEESSSSLDRQYNSIITMLNDTSTSLGKSDTKINQMINDMHDINVIMTNTKKRGTFGEYQLYHILSLYCADNQHIYEEQYHLSNGKIGDAALHLPGNTKVLIIDSKFPMENYLKIVDNPKDISYQNEFKKNVKKHIDDISNKYITEETLEEAVMFIPSEAIYLYLCDECADLYDYAHSKKVLMTSPSTLMGVVFTLINITKDFNRSENIKDIEKRIIKLKGDTDRLDDRYGKVMKNLNTLEKSLKELEISKDKISKTINQAYDGAIEEE